MLRRSQPVHGLSPLARGTRISDNADYFDERFIPAGAGNSPPIYRYPEKYAVYPRWRGELVTFAWIDNSRTGLSPLARGTPTASGGPRPEPRFIPAGAGNSASGGEKRHGPSVYPRWRGELAMRSDSSRRASGLSPLARGTPADRLAATVLPRFIPAGAGNSFYAYVALRHWAVYPRWRGELS